ncbi:hypothetical protein ABO04_00065 [Nitrosomonas sp. HPC101]|nr:hypothetical protein [Nitrosomonas sp. HPC101]
MNIQPAQKSGVPLSFFDKNIPDCFWKICVAVFLIQNSGFYSDLNLIENSGFRFGL